MPRGRLSSDYGESAKLLQDRWDTETEACRNRVDQHTPHMNQTTQVFSLFGFFIVCSAFIVVVGERTSFSMARSASLA